MAVYDEEKKQTLPSDDELRRLTGINEEQEATHEREAKLGAEKDIAEREGLSKPLSDEKLDKKSMSVNELGTAEAKSSTASAGSTINFTGGANGTDDGGGGVSKVRSFASRNKRGLLIGGGAGGGLLALLFAAFFLLIPLKIEHIVDNLDGKFMATTDDAVQNETDSLVKGYFVNYIGPALTKKNCAQFVSKDCRFGVNVLNGNPVSNLYKTWHQAKLEDTLADKYGIEIKYDTFSRTYYLKTPSLSGEGDPISNPGEADINPAMWDKTDIGGIKDAFDNAIQNESRWKQVLLRYKFGRLLEEKYGIKRFIPVALQQYTKGKINSYQLSLAQRVLETRTSTLGIVWVCLLNPDCDAANTAPTTPQEGTTAELGGAAESTTDSSIRTNLTQLAKDYGIEDEETVQKMIDTYGEISEKGYSSYLIDQVLQTFNLDAISDNVSDAAPVVGWILKASQFIGVANNAGPSLKKLSYVTNATAAVSLYMMYRSYADQIHSGNVNATEVGQWVDSLGPGDHGPPNDPEVGGTAGAEGSPLYGELVDDQPPPATSTTASIASDLLSPKAYAAATGANTSTISDPYQCSDGSTPPEGQVCPAEVLGNNGNSVLDGVHQFLNTPGIGTITQAAGIINSILGKIGGLLGNLISLLLGPLGKSLEQLISDAVQPVFKAIANVLIPNPFGSNMSGGRNFDMAAAGDDVAGNDYAHNGVGGKVLTSDEVATITNEQQDEARQQFDQQPLFARIFSTDSQYSLVSQMAMDIPLGDAGNLAQSGFASLMSNPFGKLFSGFGAILTNKASAATNDTVNLCPGPFQVTCYGYTQADLDAIGDPETYWQQNNCGDTSTNGPNYKYNLAASQYNTSSANDPDGTPLNTGTDPCLLIQASVGAAGGYFDTSNLTPDDLADTGGQ